MFDFVNAPLMKVNLSLLAEAPPPNLATDGNGSCAKRIDSLISRGARGQKMNRRVS
jgi:hypothetical protein